MDAKTLRKKVNEIEWFHSIDLGNGVFTLGKDNTSEKLKTLNLPSDLSGMSVLDIGAWDGFFSFECEKRGAKSVLATDSFCWDGDGWGTKDGFLLAKKGIKL